MGKFNFSKVGVNGQYSVKLKSGNYRVYDANGQEVWKSPGKSENDKQQAVRKVNSLAGPLAIASPSPANVKKDIVNDMLNQAAEETQNALSEQKDLTLDERLKLENFDKFLTTARARSKRTGESVEDIIKEWDQNPESKPAELKDIALDDATLLKLLGAAEGSKGVLRSLDAIQSGQEKRQGIVENLAERLSEKEGAKESELGLMTASNTGTTPYQTLWNEMTDEQKETMTPDQLRRLQMERDLNKGKEASFEAGDRMRQALPGEDFKLNWNDQPTFEGAKNIWNQDFKPNYVYDSARPFDSREHQLAASGHGKGSSTLIDNDSRKSSAIYGEDLRNIQSIQNMLETEHRSKGSTIEQLGRLTKNMSDAYGIPVERASDIIGRHVDQADTREYRDSIFEKDIAEGKINLANVETQENLLATELAQAQNQQQMQQDQQLGNQIYQFGILASQFDQLGAEEQQKFALLKENVWQNRAQIITMLQRAGREQEAFELQKEAANKEAFMKKIAMIAKVAGTVGLVAAGQPALAAGLWAPSLASSLNTSTLPKALGGQGGWFGGSAQAGLPSVGGQG